ncbi:hypothetical protein V5T82_04505 [Magnetovibrio sp. PR-2]|uniref:hypothetical protein n=1 Tax=Magnetovibrio sp. PR-2 TaxID=3120356 RepID=UPI002FCE340E
MSYVDRAITEAYIGCQDPLMGLHGRPEDVGPADGQPLYVGDIPGFLAQAKLSMQYWPTAENLIWWQDRLSEQSFGGNPAFFNKVMIGSALRIIAMNIREMR